MLIANQEILKTSEESVKEAVVPVIVDNTVLEAKTDHMQSRIDDFEKKTTISGIVNKILIGTTILLTILNMVGK